MAFRREQLPAPISVRRRGDGPCSAASIDVASLIAHAHRLARRRALIEVASGRIATESGAGRLMSDARQRRLAERGARLMVAFHAALNRRFATDRFDDALQVFRADSAARARRSVAGLSSSVVSKAHPGDFPPRTCPTARLGGGGGLDSEAPKVQSWVVSISMADGHCRGPTVGPHHVAASMKNRAVIPARWYCRKAQQERARSCGRNCSLPPPSVALCSAAPPPVRA